MKKKLYAFVALCLLSISMNTASAQSWQWGKRAGSNFDETGPGGEGNESTIDMAIDYNGNVYSLCFTYGKLSTGPAVNLDVDGHSLANYGLADILLTSFNCKGEYRWSKTIGTAQIGDKGIALRTDELGGVYVLGKYVSYNYGSPLVPLHVDTDTTLNVDNRSVFLVKYDTAGNYQWIRTPEPDTMGYVFGRDRAVYNSQPVEMAINAENEVCVLGYLRPGAFEGGAYVVSGTEMSYHMLIYDRYGAFKKGYKMDMACTGKFNNAGYNSMKMSFDKQRNKWYLVGYLSKGFSGFEDTLSMGGSYIKGTGYLGRFDDKGNLEWLRENTWVGSIANNTGFYTRPYVDKFSNVYVAGIGQPKNSFLGYTFENSLGFGTSSVGFIMKIDSAGNRLWTKASTTNAAASVAGLTMQGNTVSIGGVYVGKMNWDSYSFYWNVGGTYIPFLARFNSITGEIFGIDTLSSKMTLNGSLGVIQADRFSNNYYGAGFLSDIDLVVGPNTLVSAGGKSDIFLAKHGRDNCDCIVAPTANYSVSTPTGSLSSSFTFVGTSPSDSVVWYFGDSTEARGSSPTHTFKSKGVYNVCVVVYNRCGSDVYCKDVSVGSTSINEAVIANIKIYPNPATDIINIEGLPNGTSISLYNMLGQEVAKETNSTNIAQISVRGMASGLYLVQMKDAEGNVYSAKIMKQ